MADNLRSATEAGQNPSFVQPVSKQEDVLGDKAVGGMDNDKDHTGNVAGGLKATMNNDNFSQKTQDEAKEKLDALKQK